MSDNLKIGKMLNSKNIAEFIQAFKKADVDHSNGLDIEELRTVFMDIGMNVSEEEVKILHMQIDANCDGTVDLKEFLYYFSGQTRDLSMVCQLFPRPSTTISVPHNKNIMRLLFVPFEEYDELGLAKPSNKEPGDKEPNRLGQRSVGGIRPYQRGQYISLTSDGNMDIWNDSFDERYNSLLIKEESTLPFSHNRRMCVTDMMYIQDTKELVISSPLRELWFYSWSQEWNTFIMSYSIILEDGAVTAMNYCSTDKKSVFSFGDEKGNMFVIISTEEKKQLIPKRLQEEISYKDYPIVHLSNLLKTKYREFICVKIPIFRDVCSQIRYLPSLNSLVVCGKSSKTMVVVTEPVAPSTKFTKRIFSSSEKKRFFACVEYCNEVLLTGGTDGLLRVWAPNCPLSCLKALPGHTKRVTNIFYNHNDNIILSISVDKNIRVWSVDELMCMQSFFVEDMTQDISSICYNVYNNELFLITSDIRKYLGKGTDLYESASTSHEMPLCNAIYHGVYKQVISVCQNGVVTIWDIKTGKPIRQFKVTTGKEAGKIVISLDGSGRRLITITPDRKMRTWNINSGTELSVHPAVLPSNVTSIVCHDDRVFVSGSDSKFIYNLDIDRQSTDFWKHDYLPDIAAMYRHKNMLITSASSGNIVCWDLGTSKVIYWISARSNMIHFAEKKDQGQTGKLVECRSTRKTSPTQSPTAVNRRLILCQGSKTDSSFLFAKDDSIYTWYKGWEKLLAVQDEKAVITTWKTDSTESILLTGDSSGRVCLWDISRRSSISSKPRLSWKAHTEGVVSVDCDPICDYIITSGLDCNVKLWTKTGECRGIFGKDEWGAMQLNTVKTSPGQDRVTRGERPCFRVHSEVPDPIEEMYKEYERFNDMANQKAMELEAEERRFLNEKEFKRMLKCPSQCPPKTQRPADAGRRGVKHRVVGLSPGTGGTGLYPTPPKTTLPDLNQSRFTNGRRLKIYQQDPINSGLTPIPPSRPLPEELRLPPIQKVVDFSDQQSPFQPRPPHTQVIRGDTKLDHGTPQKPFSNVNLAQPKHGRRKLLQRESLKSNTLKPPPDDAYSDKIFPCTVDQLLAQHKSKPLRFPRIPAKVQLTAGQTFN